LAEALKLKVLNYEKFGLKENPIKEVRNYKVPLVGKSRDTLLYELLCEIATYACYGGPKPWYILGDWGSGKSTLFANLVSNVNKSLFIRTVKDTVEGAPEHPRFDRAIGIFLRKPEDKPSGWVLNIRRREDGVLEIPQDHDQIWYLRLLSHIILQGALNELSDEDIKASLKGILFRREPNELRLLQNISLEEVDEHLRSDSITINCAKLIVRNYLAKKGAEGPIVDFILDCLDPRQSSSIESKLENLEIKDFFKIFKDARCLVVLVLDQLESCFTQENLNFVLDISRFHDNVLPVIIDQVERAEAGRRRTKADAVLESIKSVAASGITNKVRHTLRKPLDKGIDVELKSIWKARVERVRFGAVPDPYYPYDEEALDILIKEAQNIVRLFLKLTREILVRAARECDCEIINKDYIKKEKVQALIDEIKRDYGIAAGARGAIPSPEELATAGRNI